jgi:hypothetical protein
MSEEQSKARKTNRIMRPMWIFCQLDDSRCLKAVCEKVGEIVQEMSGEVLKSSSMGDLFVVATFPHRKYKTVEKAIAAALSGQFVKRTIVVGQDPYVVRNKTMALTMDLYRRQDEVLGL